MIKLLYEDNKLWLLKLTYDFKYLCMESMESFNVKKIYFDINQYKITYTMNHDDIINNLAELTKYTRKYNIFPILDWLWDYFENWFQNIDILAMITIETACKNNNLDLLKYIINKFGISEEIIINESKTWETNIGYIKFNDKCVNIQYDYYSMTAKCLHLATINNNIEILDFFEKNGSLYNTTTQIKTPLYPYIKSINIACKRGHFELMTWCRNRGLC